MGVDGCAATAGVVEFLRGVSEVQQETHTFRQASELEQYLEAKIGGMNVPPIP